MDFANDEKMEHSINALEAKFRVAESEINLIEKKVTADFYQAQEQEDKKINPSKVLERLDRIKKEYSALLQESVEIKKAQEEMMTFFQSQIAQACETIKQISSQANLEIEDNDEENKKECADDVGMKMPQTDMKQKASEKLGGTFDLKSMEK